MKIEIEGTPVASQVVGEGLTVQIRAIKSMLPDLQVGELERVRITIEPLSD